MRAQAAALLAAMAVLVAGCDGGDVVEPSDGNTKASNRPSSVSVEANTPLTMEGPWVKSSAGKPMTGVFGTLKNNTESDIVVTAGTSDAAAKIELHETVDAGNGTMAMQQKDGGFVIPPGESFELKPGGNHIMLMELKREIKAGDTVTITLSTQQGQELEFTATAMDFDGGNETYHTH